MYSEVSDYVMALGMYLAFMAIAGYTYKTKILGKEKGGIWKLKYWWKLIRVKVFLGMTHLRRKRLKKRQKYPKYGIKNVERSRF